MDTAEKPAGFGYGVEVIGRVMTVLAEAVKVRVTVVWHGRGLEGVGDGGGMGVYVDRWGGESGMRLGWEAVVTALGKDRQLNSERAVVV